MEEEAATLDVLIVTSSTADQEGLRMMLVNAGFKSEAFSDTEAAIDRAMEVAFKLIIVDYNLPMTNGIDLSTRFRKLRSHRHTPIILVADRAMGHIRQAAQTLARVTLLKKPVPETVMLARVRHAMKVVSGSNKGSGLGVGRYMDHDPNRG